MTKRRRTLPPVSTKVPVELRPLISAMTEILETGEGVRGDPLDRKVTLRDLVDSGIGKMKGGARPGAGGGLMPGVEPPAPDLSTPPPPQGFAADGSFYGMIILSWQIPSELYRNHAYTNIYRSEEDNYANAEIVGREIGAFYSDFVRNDALDPDDPTLLKGYYYWISFSSVAGVEGPPNAGAGTFARPIADVGYVIELLTGQIDETLLAQTLREEIQKIDIHDHRFDDVESRLDDERERLDGRVDELRGEITSEKQRVDTIRDDLSDQITSEKQRVDTIRDDVLESASDIDAIREDLNGSELIDGTVANRIAKEREARIEALGEERDARVFAINYEHDARVGAIQAEAQARGEHIAEVQQTLEDADGFLAAQLHVLAAAEASKSATIYSLNEIRITEEESMALRVDGVETSVGNNSSSIIETSQALTNLESSTATSIAALSAKIDALPTIANGFEPGFEFDGWMVAPGNSLSADAGDSFSGVQSAIIGSSEASVDTASPPFAISLKVPEGTSGQFSGYQLRISIASKEVSGGSSAFAVGYAASSGWFSGWSDIVPGSAWSVTEVFVNVPESTPGDHYIVLWGDTSGAGGSVKVDRLLVEVANSSIPEITSQIEEIREVVATKTEATAERINNLESEYDGQIAAITSTQATMSDDHSALAEQVDAYTAATDETLSDIQTSVRVLSEEDSALAERIDDLYVEVGDVDGRITEQASLQAEEDRLQGIIQSVISAGVNASSASIGAVSKISVESDRVTGLRVDSIEGRVEGAEGAISDIMRLDISPDSVLITRLQEIEGSVGEAEGAIADVRNLKIEPSSALITRFEEVEGRVGSTEGSITDIENLDLAPNSALISRFEEVEGSVAGAEGRITNIENLDISPDSVLMGKISTLEADTETASGRIDDITNLTIDENSSLAKKISAFEAEFRPGNTESRINQVREALAEEDSALGRRIDSVETSLGDAETSFISALEAEVSGSSLVADGSFTSGSLDAWGQTSNIGVIKASDSYGAVADNSPATHFAETLRDTYGTARSTTGKWRTASAGDIYTLSIDYTARSGTDGSLRFWVQWSDGYSIISSQNVGVFGLQQVSGGRWASSEPSRVTAPDGAVQGRVVITLEPDNTTGSACFTNVKAYRADRATVSLVQEIEANLESAEGNILEMQGLVVGPDSTLVKDISSLEGKVGDAEGAIADIRNLDISPGSALISRFSEVEGRVGSTEGSITDIQNLDLAPDSAIISRFSEVEGRVGTTEGAISNIESLKLSPGSALITRFNSVEGEVERAQGSIKSIEDLTLSSGSALIGRFEALEGSVDDAQGAINDIRDLNISGDSALATRLSGLEASIGNVEAGASQQLSSEVERIDGDITAVSQAVTQVQADTGDEFAAVQTTLSANVERIDGELVALGASYTAQVQANGLIGGFGVYNDGTTVDAAFNVDRFWIGRSQADKRNPFVVVNGVVYIDTAMIRDASIQEGKIGPITVGKLRRPDGTPITTVGGLIRADAIDVNNLSVAEAARFSGDVTSTNYQSGVSGWRILQDGTVEFNQGVYRGPVEFAQVSGAGDLASKNSLSYSEVTGTKPPTNADRTADNTAYDTARVAGTTASTVLARANAGNDAATRVNSWVRPTSTLIDGNKIFTGDAYVDTLQIKGQAVTVPATSTGGSIRVATGKPGNLKTWSSYVTLNEVIINPSPVGGRAWIFWRWRQGLTTGNNASIRLYVRLMIVETNTLIDARQMDLISSNNSMGGTQESMNSYSFPANAKRTIRLEYIYAMGAFPDRTTAVVSNRFIGVLFAKR